MARELHIESSDNQVKRIHLDDDSYSLGRAHTNKLCYPDDASLSRSHMLIEQDGAEWVVSDLGSKNGTLVNGTRITGATKLSPGDRMAAGHLVLRFVDPDVKTSESVIFVPGSTAEMAPGATVMTSLEGLLSSDSKGRAERPQPAGPGAQPDQAFGLPIVQALIRAGRELAGHRPLGELFTLILDLSIEAVGAERGVLMTLEGDELVSRAVHGEGFRISTMVRDRVLRDKTSVLVRDIQQDQALLQQLSISEQQIHSLMAVPLQTESDVIGLVASSNCVSWSSGGTATCNRPRRSSATSCPPPHPRFRGWTWRGTTRPASRWGAITTTSYAIRTAGGSSWSPTSPARECPRRCW